MRPLVIIPTFNEKANLTTLIPEVFRLCPEVSILVVDDNSPDGTADLVHNLINTFPQLHLLKRQRKEGLGKAYLAGFSWGLERGFSILFEMDADWSHRPQDLKKLLDTLKREDVDVVVGSRYVPGGEVPNWGWHRRLISKWGSIYSRWILGYPLSDWTGGFNGWKDYVLKSIDLSQVQSEGYAFQIELKYKALKLNYKVVEVPIIFEDRRVGQSKMSFKIILEAIARVWKIKQWQKSSL